MDKTFLKGTAILLILIATIAGCANKPQKSKLVKYGQIYTQLIQNQLDTSKMFQGEKCKLQFSLNSSGQVISLASSGHENLCKASEDAVKKVGAYPLPKDKEVAAQLQQITLTIKP
ncbi:cell envelope integrity protein TolA [Vibrio sp. TRT 21S02]|uniref:cell envelope integrity protein TolA n=1 Tax=Vibrio sp. TRT 21S02 TaxID=3418507 RepID=UPI003CF788BB